MSIDGVGEIEGGGDGRGNRPAPPEQPCGCVVQQPVQADGACTMDRTTTITLIGVGGGTGTSTVAAVLALIGRTMVPTELVTGEHDRTAALLGVALDEDPRGEILGGLRLVVAPSGNSELTVVDGGALAGTPPMPHGPGERRLGVLRGPCYLALRSVLAAGQHGLDGLILVAEPGRALSARDATDVTGLDVVATVLASPAVARIIDAGLLASRANNRPEFRDLHRWLRSQLDPFPAPRSPVASAAPLDPPRTGTDLLVALLRN